MQWQHAVVDGQSCVDLGLANVDCCHLCNIHINVSTVACSVQA